MGIFNKHFWKFVGGFIGIVILAIGLLWGFEYWRNHKEKQEAGTLMKEIDQKENN